MYANFAAAIVFLAATATAAEPAPNTNRFARVIRLKPGSYRWVVGRKVGRAAWDRRATLLVQHVRITAASARVAPPA